MLRLKFEDAMLLRAVLLLAPAPFCATELSIDSRIYVEHLLLPAVFDSWLLPKFFPPIPIRERECVCVCLCVWKKCTLSTDCCFLRPWNCCETCEPSVACTLCTEKDMKFTINSTGRKPCNIRYLKEAWKQVPSYMP